MVHQIKIIWNGMPAFFDICNGIFETFKKLNYNVQIQTYMEYIDDTLYLFIPLVNFIHVNLDSIKYIAYHIEQDTSPWITEKYKQVLQNATYLWSSCPINSNSLDVVRHYKNHKYVPFGYHDGILMQSNNINEQDIDILFVGSLNKRRLDIINLLKQNGMSVVYLFDISRDEHIKQIKRCKIYLNIHYYGEISALEMARIALALGHSKCVVSEPSYISEENNMVGDLIVFSHINNIIDVCKKYVNDNMLRKTIEHNLPERFKKCLNLKPSVLSSVHFIKI